MPLDLAYKAGLARHVSEKNNSAPAASPYSGELHTILEITLATLRYYFMQIKADSVPVLDLN